jgi:ABC-2 type transport system ATP-binding protein
LTLGLSLTAIHRTTDRGRPAGAEWAEGQVAGQNPEHPSGVVLSNVVKTYGAVRAVRGVNIRIAPGETIAVLGPNGAGKTTTVEMLLGLARPDAGTVTVFGMSPGEAVRSGAVGGMLQTGSLLRHLSVRELIELVASLYPAPLSVEQVLRTADLIELADRRSHTLSGGQSQRVRFAMALVANPDLLVLDEPTTGLDVASRRAFWSAMRGSAAQGKTVVFVTHYLEEADAFADRIILMAEGQVVADGSVTEIKAAVGTTVIRATLPGVDAGSLAELPGVSAVERHGDSIQVRCDDSNVALSALLARYPEARDIEVRRAALEEAFLELTGQDEDAGGRVPTPPRRQA